MIILHGSASDGRLVLWGEASLESNGKPVRRAARKRAQRSRFALETDRLAEAAAGELADFKASKDQREIWTAWLPSNERGAIPSSPLLLEEPEEQGEVKLSAWETPAIVLTNEQAVSVLVAALGRTTWGPGVVVGKTLSYWASVLGLAAALVARQQYLPGLDVRGGGAEFFAQWEPVLIGEDRLAAERLARSMPHACRALDRAGDGPPETAGSTVLSEILHSLVDQLVRTATAPPSKNAGRFVSQHDHWVHALRSGEGRMNGDAAELARLAEQVRQWRRPIELAASAPYRLCLRLEEPKVGPQRQFDQWRVGYLLQAMDDPSLLVPVKSAWKARGREAMVLHRDGFQPREYLLSALGQAAAICPRIEASLKSAAPAGYTVDSRGAHEFLSERAAASSRRASACFCRRGGVARASDFCLTA